MRHHVPAVALACCASGARSLVSLHHHHYLHQHRGLAALPPIELGTTSNGSRSRAQLHQTRALCMGRQREGAAAGQGGSRSKGKAVAKGDLPTKVCATCGRPFTWRKKWDKVWDEVRYCSDRCRNSRPTAITATTTDATAAHRRSHRPPPPTLPLQRRHLFTAAAAAVAASSLLPPHSAWAVQGRAPRPTPAEVAAVLQNAEWDPEVLFSRSDFARLDPRADALFYDAPKLVEHIDAPAVAALSSFYAQLLLRDVPRELLLSTSRPLLSSTGDGGGASTGAAVSAVSAAVTEGFSRLPDVLDLCASHVSHLPPQYAGDRGAAVPRVAGLGMNADELRLNGQLTEYVVRDLNVDPRLPYDDASFDAVVCALSIDYLVRPLEVMREVGRVLRRGGTAAIIFSDRLFLTKAVALWSGAADVDHVYTVGAYFHYCGGGFGEPRALDVMHEFGKGGRGGGDPLYAVVAHKV